MDPSNEFDLCATVLAIYAIPLVSRIGREVHIWSLERRWVALSAGSHLPNVS